MKKIVWIGLMVSFSYGVSAQLSLGLVNGNFSGVSGSLINPSSMTNSKISADINLFAVRGFVENNYLYFPSRQASFVTLANGAYDYQLFPKPYGTGNRYVYTYYNDRSVKDAIVNTRVTGPSVMFSVQDHVFAVRTGARFMSTTRNLPYDMANFSYYTMDFRPQHDTYFVRDNYEMTTMAWYEVMASYATVFNHGKSNLWSVGVSAGPLFGYSGAYVVGGDTRYMVYDENTLNVEHLDAEFGMSLPVDYNTNELDFYNPAVRGNGWGMDLGITWQYRDRPYKRKIHRDCYRKGFEEYQFKMGVSLIDIGWVNFTKNAERHVFKDVSNNWIRVDDFKYTNIKEGLNTASAWMYGDSAASFKGDKIRIYLPATLGFQFDYHVVKNWYVNSTVAIPLKYTSPMLNNPVIISLTPRYESRFLEVNLPFVLYDYKYPRFGLSIRVDGLTIGTDNMMCFTSAKDITGADIYISYRVMIRNDGKNAYRNRGACYNNWRSQILAMRK
jgi:hypothetical protein